MKNFVKTSCKHLGLIFDLIFLSTLLVSLIFLFLKIKFIFSKEEFFYLIYGTKLLEYTTYLTLSFSIFTSASFLFQLGTCLNRKKKNVKLFSSPTASYILSLILNIITVGFFHAFQIEVCIFEFFKLLQ